jgi:hypothetical protein
MNMKYLFLALIALLFVPQVIFAHTDEVPTVGATESAAINSFEAFWPLTAGKTLGENFYFLKTLKEDLRGILIFGKPEKGEYLVFRSTKRLLEAESLLANEKNDLAKQTVVTANGYLTQAKANFEGVTGRDDMKSQVKNRLDNLIILVDQVTAKTDGEIHDQFHITHDLIEETLSLVRK